MSALFLDNEAEYLSWKTEKQHHYPHSLAELVVEVEDPFALTPHEVSALLTRCAKSNMALFRLTHPERIQENPLPALTARLGIHQVDKNLGADGDGVSALTPGGSAHAPFAHYIPYREAAIGWHTDGYYNPIDQPVQSLCLYCERPAQEGGENELLDHDLVYIRLRDQHPEALRALMEPDVMTIPARLAEDGTIARPERTGPVFFVTAAGHLQMRFTNRTKSIRWRDEAATQTAVEILRQILRDAEPIRFRGRLEQGWGLISNNVLHTRAGFSDPPGGLRRVLYRARYFDRLPTGAA
ncbi:MAG: TauD/TfdA family dioxygenase [Magnetococcales bacterium]|nr:TauD/TfdA family dioxygenase [Magnetococcales bacterium]